MVLGVIVNVQYGEISLTVHFKPNQVKIRKLVFECTRDSYPF